MSDKKKLIKQISGHAWLWKIWRRLDHSDIQRVEAFLDENLPHPTDVYEMNLNRLYLDMAPGTKPKRWKEIMEVLCCMNTMRRDGSSGGKR